MLCMWLPQQWVQVGSHVGEGQLSSACRQQACCALPVGWKGRLRLTVRVNAAGCLYRLCREPLYCIAVSQRCDSSAECWHDTPCTC